MPKRTIGHVHETIADRAFENALNSGLVANPVVQGRDYGIDYRVQSFDNNGTPVGGFDVQVKYVPASKTCERSIFGFYRHKLRYNEPSYVAHPISLDHLRHYVDHKASPQPVLYVVANEDELFYHWIDDLHEFYLQWLPQATTKSRTIYFCDIRSFHRRHPEDIYVVLPSQPFYQESVDTFFLHSLAPRGHEWLSRWLGPRTVDSLTNLACCIYLQNSSPRSRVIQEFRVQEFFDFLLVEERQRPWVFILFSHFLGLTAPTEQMRAWAVQEIRCWKNGLRIPAALQILSRTPDEQQFRAVLESLDEHSLHSDLLDYEELFWGTQYHPRTRFLTDYLWAKASFLIRHLERGTWSDSQERLIRAYLNFAYSFEEANVYAVALADALKKRKILPNASYQALLQACALTATARVEEVIRGIWKRDNDIWDEERNG
jgi:hypothetical protein